MITNTVPGPKNEGYEAVTPAQPHVSDENMRLGLCLSGGGLRASVFHLGLLRYMAEKGLLEKIEFVSTVSGGSLLAGLVFSKSGYAWPDSQSFRKENGIYDEVKWALQHRNLERDSLLRLCLPWNWRKVPWRANILADSIKSLWSIRAALNVLPARPVWSINGTTMETGRRWGFRVERSDDGGTVPRMGDGLIGYTDAPRFSLAQALATSAAFPGGMTPLRIKKDGHKWNRPFDTKQDVVKLLDKLNNYHIADGGIYDNLGLEPVFDVSLRRIRPESNCNFLVVSDAGAPLGIKPWKPLAQLSGFSSRMLNITYAQSRNLRTRSFVGALSARECEGLFIDIAQSAAATAASYSKHAGSDIAAAVGDLKQFLSQKDVDAAASYPTTLRPLSEKDFTLIERHGYECAKLQWEFYGPKAKPPASKNMASVPPADALISGNAEAPANAGTA